MSNCLQKEEKCCHILKFLHKSRIKNFPSKNQNPNEYVLTPERYMQDLNSQEKLKKFGLKLWC